MTTTASTYVDVLLIAVLASLAADCAAAAELAALLAALWALPTAVDSDERLDWI